MKLKSYRLVLISLVMVFSLGAIASAELSINLSAMTGAAIVKVTKKPAPKKSAAKKPVTKKIAPPTTRPEPKPTESKPST